MQPPDSALILGGSGFLGRALANRLGASGKQTCVLARSKAPAWIAASGARYEQGAIDDESLLEKFLPHSEWVIHLACDSVPGTSSGPVAEATENLLPTLNFLEVLQGFPAARLLFVSTGGAIYGNTPDQATDEHASIDPFSNYAAGKASVEAFIHAFCQQHGREAVILRPANLYGPGQTIRPGFGIIPGLLHAAASGGTFEIWGDGEIVRDFLYINDFLNLCERLFLTPRNQGVRTYNVGSGQGRTLNTLCTETELATGKKINRIYKPARRVDVGRIVLDSSKAQRELGWSATTGLAAGLTETWKWFSENRR